MIVLPNLPPAPWKPEHFRVAAPVGFKPCQTCYRHIRTTDRHARCQRCRNAGGYQYLRTCPGCGDEYTALKPHQVCCSRECVQRVKQA